MPTCRICGTPDAACTGHAPAPGESVHLNEGRLTMAEVAEYEVTEVDRKGRVNTFTQQLTAEEAARIGARPVGAPAQTKARGAKNKARSAASK